MSERSLRSALLVLGLCWSHFTGLAQDHSAAPYQQFNDELLDHFLGKWELKGTVNGAPAMVTLESEWILNHQWLQIKETGNSILPGMNVPYQGLFIIGFDHKKKQYVRHLMNIFGADDPVNITFFGKRTGNAIRLAAETSPGLVYIEEFTWKPGTGSWHLVSRIKKHGKEMKPYLDMEATPLQ